MDAGDAILTRRACSRDRRGYTTRAGENRGMGGKREVGEGGSGRAMGSLYSIRFGHERRWKSLWSSDARHKDRRQTKNNPIRPFRVAHLPNRAMILSQRLIGTWHVSAAHQHRAAATRSRTGPTCLKPNMARTDPETDQDVIYGHSEPTSVWHVPFSSSPADYSTSTGLSLRSCLAPKLEAWDMIGEISEPGAELDQHPGVDESRRSKTSESVAFASTKISTFRIRLLYNFTLFGGVRTDS